MKELKGQLKDTNPSSCGEFTSKTSGKSCLIFKTFLCFVCFGGLFFAKQKWEQAAIFINFITD